MRHFLKIFSVLCFLNTWTSVSHSTDYVIDTDHSGVSFIIKHLFSKVRGTFDKFQGTFSFDPNNPAINKTKITVDAASINTKVAKRDTHLRGEDFFHVAKFPQLTFESTGYDIMGARPPFKDKPHKAKMPGKLTLKGITKDIVLNVSYNGQAVDPWGNISIAFEAGGSLSRKEFGLVWNKVLETGRLLVGDEVDIEILVEGNPKPTKK